VNSRQQTECRVVLVAARSGGYTAVELDADDAEAHRFDLSASEMPAWVAAQERANSPRWVIRSAREIYPVLLDAGVMLARSHDLLLCHAILRHTDKVPRPLAPSSSWVRREPVDEAPALFDVVAHDAPDDPVGDAIDQYREQRRVLRDSKDGRLTLLTSAESAGGLIAEEMRAAGLPWNESVHDGILTEILGTRPIAGGLPSRMGAQAERVRSILGDPHLNLESQPKLLRALHRVGVQVESTGRWELAQHSHAVVEPLLAYKKLSRLLSANGWAWLAEWVHDGRFRPIYITGGVVTGRWASAGGGALQLPRNLRAAVRADDGWTLVVADVAQLEPRMLAGMAGDRAMARAAQGKDLYAGVVESVPWRRAKRRSTPSSGRCTERRPVTAVGWFPDCARCIRALWRSSTRLRGSARTGESCRRGWGGRLRVRRSSGRRCRPPPPVPTPTPPRWHSPAGARATGDASPATSWCRAPRQSGR